MNTFISSRVPESRIRVVNLRAVSTDATRVVYWMTAARRGRFNFALQRAADWARHLQKPLLVLEALRCDYPWASDRLHQFVIDGMQDNASVLRAGGATHYPYIEPEVGAGRGLLQALCNDAAVVITDDFPTFFLPKMVAAAGSKIPVRLEAVDGNGLMPMSAPGREFATAYSYRRFIQKSIFDLLDHMPLENPLADSIPPPSDLPGDIVARWPLAMASPDDQVELHTLPIDHHVSSTALRGGSRAAGSLLQEFLDHRLEVYDDERNRPESEATSGLSAHLHFGHISAHEVFMKIMSRERWSPEDVVPPNNGRRAGWWGVRHNAEAFLDQLITWRELGFNVCFNRNDHDRWESLPEWAQRTLTEHAIDTREYVYTLEQFADAGTHDPLWNAAQTQLVREGTIHNYLRMLWGKKILEWTSEPREALEVMIELNNRYALDGRDPNSYTGIFWVLGRHDRPWGPERPVFGKVRYMSSANTARKFPVRSYLERYGGLE